MPDVLHPWIAEARLTARRRFDARGRAGVALLAIASLLVLAAWTMSAGGWSSAGWAATGLRAFAQWPLPITLLLTGLSYRLSRSRVWALSQRVRSGWWAAAPVHPGQLARTLLLLSAAALLVALAAATALLVATALAAGPLPAPRSSLLTALAVTATGLIFGTGVGTWSALRRRNAHKAVAREGIRQPLFAWPWLDDRRLPHLCDWQRRETVLRWRRGGNAGWLAAVALAVPSGSPVSAVLGVLLLATLLAWLAVAQRASADSAVRAAQWLRATPVSAAQMFRTSLRYPLFAAACALGIGGLAIAPLGVAAIGGWALLVAAFSLRLPLTWWWHLRRPGKIP